MIPSIPIAKDDLHERSWIEFRNDAAMKILCASCSGTYTSMDVQYAKKRCEEAIAYADELVRQLKEATYNENPYARYE